MSKIQITNTCPKCDKVDVDLIPILDGERNDTFKEISELCIACHYQQKCPHNKNLTQTCPECGIDQVVNTVPQNPNNLKWHNDPAHGWLEVPLAKVIEMGVEISEFSYQDDVNAYLEEDSDAPKYLRYTGQMSLMGSYLPTGTIEEINYDDCESNPIRSMARYGG